ncbi:MAG TPA: D-alanyl-D-alanine carboxypeptidase/D-alanyl-D-alanine-endopeptidase [Polyangiales bacterium]|nr:D-alanyl-D-alanine carboxypeptidase/D-alanyl-D-alanine-endopeptidase [Polyangiales bacterium]
MRLRKPSIASPIALTLVLSAVAIHAPASAQPSPADTALGPRIEGMLAQAKLSPQVALSIVDIETGRSLVSLNAQTPLNPASNLKLVTAAAALRVLGADFRMQTGLYGQVRQERTEALCLKGQADPTLTRANLAEFVLRLRERGVREIDQLTVDGSYFDNEILPPAFEQQPNETAPFRAAVGAVSVNANAYTLRIGPGVSLGAPARVAVDGAGYFKIENQVTTTNSPTSNVSVDERDLGDSVALTLTGNVPLTGATLALPRRVASPLYYAGHVFLDALSAAGIHAPSRVLVGNCRADAPLIARIESAPLAELLGKLGKNSDNFVAETLVKIMGAERTRKPGSTAAGIIVIQDALRQMNLPVANNLHMINGSGLFQGNLVTTDLFSQLLAAMYRDPAYRPEYVAQLSVGGADGTLARRFSHLARPRVVRAKTGTLNDVIALSGYVLGPTPGRAYAFSYLANGIKGKQAQARGLIDRIVELLVAAP